MDKIILDNLVVFRRALQNTFLLQVLKLVDDLRNHPASVFLDNNIPMVISADDPSVWGAEGLTYDFYAAFMALAAADDGLKVVKQLAMNSLM